MKPTNIALSHPSYAKAGSLRLVLEDHHIKVAIPDGVLDAAAHMTTQSLTPGSDHGGGSALACRQHSQAHVSMSIMPTNHYTYSPIIRLNT